MSVFFSEQLTVPSSDLTFVHTLTHPDLSMMTMDDPNDQTKTGRRPDKHLSLATIKFLVNKTKVEAQPRY